MEEEQCVTVITRLLNELLNPNVIITECQVASLVKSLTGIPDDKVTPLALNNILVTWLTEAVSRWETNFNPNLAVLTLALNLSVYLSSQEKNFLQLNNDHIFQRFIKLIKKALSEMEATPNIGYIKLMSAFLTHNSGCQWIISSGHWSEIILLTLSSPVNSDFVQAGYKFVSKLIANSASKNFEFCSRVITLIIAPIIDIATCPDNMFNKSMIQNRESTFNLVNIVLENLLEERKVSVFKAVLKVVSDVKFESYLQILRKKIADECMSFPITISTHILLFYKLVIEQNKLRTGYIYYEYFFKVARNVLDFFEIVIKNGPFQLFMEIGVITNRFCVKLGPLSPRIKTKDNIITSLHEQAVLCQLYPCAYLSIKLFGIDHFNTSEDDIREYTMTTAMKRVLPQTVRFIFLLRHTFAMNFSLDQSMKSLKYFSSMRDQIISKESRTLSLQMLITCFEDVSTAIKCRPDDIFKLPGNDTYILSLMETITILLKDFDINWQDIFETMLLLDITTSILQFHTWEKKMYVCGFNLMGIAFSKNLTMNMALLTDHFKENDYLERIITLVEDKLNHSCWEVRCSAIEVIGAISKNVKRFSWLATLLINKNIPLLILKKAFKDEEAAVRASTFKCLKEMAKVELLWDTLQENGNFYDDLTLCLYVDVDPKVRCEAADLVVTIYEYQEVFTTNLFTLYDVMTYSVVEDPNKEVKISSLQFWKKVIASCLVFQGMLDGEFPEVTFSKQTRKIVVLDNKEITKRLFRVLEELSENGCLAVLLSALKDDPVVQNAAMAVISKFMQHLRKYGLLDKSLNLLDVDEEELFSSYVENVVISNKMFGRRKLSTDIFLNVLSKHPLLTDTNKSNSISKQLELLLQEILNQSR